MSAQLQEAYQEDCMTFQKILETEILEIQKGCMHAMI